MKPDPRLQTTCPIAADICVGGFDLCRAGPGQFSEKSLFGKQGVEHLSKPHNITAQRLEIAGEVGKAGQIAFEFVYKVGRELRGVLQPYWRTAQYSAAPCGFAGPSV